MNPFLAIRDHAKEVYDTLSGNERIKERTRGLYDQVVNRGVKPSFPMLLKDPQNVTMDDLLASGFGVMPMAIKAFHGSPHLFDKFDMSKIGTGEGAQAYGHGLYMAESPDVAKTYLNEGLNAARNGEIDNLPEPIRMPVYNALQTPIGIIRDSKINKIKNDYPDLSEYIDKAIKENKGNLYETSLQWPDPAREAADPMGPQHFLDWDRPLSEQPDFIKNILSDVPEIPNTKKTTYGVISTHLGHDPEKELYKRGIPGIRYLDQGSRGAGNGTYNYVVFDDSIPKIVKRNGKPVNTGLPPTQFSKAHEIAQRNAALPVEQGGLGLPPDNTAMDRARAMGFDTKVYRGTVGNEIEAREKQFVTLNPNTASSYAVSFDMIPDGNVMPLLIKNAKEAKNAKGIFKGYEMLSGAPNIRSRFAAFDPFKRNSADILATGIMGSLLLNELKNRNAQDNPRYR